MAEAPQAAPAPTAPLAPVAPYLWLRLRASVHGTEDEAKVAAALAAVAGLDGPGLAAVLKTTTLESQYGGTVRLLDVHMTRSRDIRAALGAVLAVPGVRGGLAATLDARVDDEGVLYFRLDKQEALRGRLALTRGDDAVQCRLRVQVHPATRENALAAWHAVIEAP